MSVNSAPGQNNAILLMPSDNEVILQRAITIPRHATLPPFEIRFFGEPIHAAAGR